MQIIFFAFGYNKSGTTYLQQLLDAHPNVNCPPEHHLNEAARYLQEFAKQYRTLIQATDERTARQGLRYNEEHVFRHAMHGLVSAFITDGAAPETTCFGLSDNLLWENLPFFAQIFPNARFIGIVRDPRAIALSLYHHRLRTEPEFRESGGSLLQTTREHSQTWTSCMAKCEEFAATPELAGRFHLVRYEDLVAPPPNNVSTLSHVFSFLGLDTDVGLVQKFLADNDFAARKAVATSAPGFLDSGPTETWRGELDADTITTIETIAGRFLAAHGYQPFAAGK